MTATAPPSIPVRPLVLVADDEAAIRELVARVITNLGFVAVLVGDGQAAIMAVTVHRGDMVCAILDIVMPIVNGVDAAGEIQQIEPNLAIVLMSGAVPSDEAERINQLRLAGLLHKPFPLAALRQMILQAAGDGAALEGKPIGGPSGYDAFEADFRDHHHNNAARRGPYEHYRLVYRYGYDLGVDPRYRGADWSSVERDARPRWEERNPGTWEEFKQTIRYAWDTARARR